MKRFGFAKLLVAVLASATLLGCASSSGAPPPPHESRSISSAAGRVQSGTLVFDVEVGVGVSRATSANGSTKWQSDSPTIP